MDSLHPEKTGGGGAIPKCGCCHRAGRFSHRNSNALCNACSKDEKDTQHLGQMCFCANNWRGPGGGAHRSSSHKLCVALLHLLLLWNCGLFAGRQFPQNYRSQSDIFSRGGRLFHGIWAADPENTAHARRETQGAGALNKDDTAEVG